MDTGAVIVAAGLSSRMGDFKPLMKIGLFSMVQRIIANFREAGVSPIVLVTGYRGEELEAHIAGTGVICVRNGDYARTKMFDSARLGFSHIGDECDRTFFTPVDIPLFSVDTLKALMASRAPVAKPVCRGRNGHPLLLSCSLLPDILNSDGEGGLKGVLKTKGYEIETIEVRDEGILWDADTPEDYARLIELMG